MTSYDFMNEEEYTQEVVFENIGDLAFDLIMTTRNCLRRYESIALLSSGDHLLELFNTVNPELIENTNINDANIYLVEIIDNHLAHINIIDISNDLIDPESVLFFVHDTDIKMSYLNKLENKGYNVLLYSLADELE